MKTLLRIDTSSRVAGSHSRMLADYFEGLWMRDHPEGKVINRDLVKQQVPHIPNRTIEGFYTPKENVTSATLQATALSDELISELKSADELLISSPLYNLNIPSNLKAYIDHVTRIGHTFGINENGYYGLLTNKKAYVITVKGGIYRGTIMEQFDFQEPYLYAILGQMGIKVEKLFSLEGTSDEKVRAENQKEIYKSIDEIFNHNENE
ncbi:NAD(P)H-dependent oxidoreductase [Fulvivirgaceae bacterium BMA12]|uniref:FMN dependent NADH:quinone oxidoreductase n=1 Tax=Agaribacillus aureus TaxID=3051825 RepID=A0ABT8LC79_9BACT|nr:NAD(P)H-dependent oxidoreductase [Fulvivirgaceae bacterium BMA12]